MLEVIAARMDEPTARGLAVAVGRAVGDGLLEPGLRLPPIRAVATGLGLSPTTVSAAWAMLARSGTIHTDGRRGTTIALRHVGPARYRSTLPHGRPLELDLSSGTPDPALLPDLTPALRRIERTFTPSSYLDDPVLPALVDVLGEQWPFPAERFTVVDGAMDALQLLAAAMLRFGDRVAVEQPSFPPLLDLLDAVGAAPVPVRVDDDGPIVDDLRRAADAGVRLVFVQPRAQNPTGASLTEDRARDLAAVLRDRDVVVVEDDSAGAVASSPAVSLGAFLAERTVHVRSYSKSHGPDLRLAAVGGPAALVDRLTELRFLGQGWTSRLLQGLLLDLLTHAPAVAAVERARATYARRRASVVDALAAAGVRVPGKDGLNIWVPVRDEPAALLRLAAAGIGVAAGAPFSVRPELHEPHVRVTVGRIANDPEGVAAALAAAALTGSRNGLR